MIRVAIRVTHSFLSCRRTARMEGPGVPALRLTSWRISCDLGEGWILRSDGPVHTGIANHRGYFPHERWSLARALRANGLGHWVVEPTGPHREPPPPFECVWHPPHHALVERLGVLAECSLHDTHWLGESTLTAQSLAARREGERSIVFQFVDATAADATAVPGEPDILVRWVAVPTFRVFDARDDGTLVVQHPAFKVLARVPSLLGQAPVKVADLEPLTFTAADEEAAEKLVERGVAVHAPNAAATQLRVPVTTALPIPGGGLAILTGTGRVILLFAAWSRRRVAVSAWVALRALGSDVWE